MQLTFAEDKRPHVVYRLYDADGALLYVGMTVRADERLEQHARDKPWWSQVARGEGERYPDRASASRAERAAILAEMPLHNVVRHPMVEGAMPMHCIRCSDELWEAGKAAASAQGTTLTAVLREALARYVRRHEKTKETDRG